MPTPPPHTLPVTLSRSEGRTVLRPFYGCPLRIQVSSPWDLSGLTTLRAEIHDQLQTDGIEPLAVATVLNPLGYSAVIDFTWSKMRLPLRGQRSATFYLLIVAALPDDSRDVYELGILQVLSNPITNLAPADPEDQLYATTQDVAALAAQMPPWVAWPLSGPYDPRGIRGSETFDPDALLFWKKARVSPPLWVPLSGGAVVSPYQVTEGGQPVTEGGQAVTEGAP